MATTSSGRSKWTTSTSFPPVDGGRIDSRRVAKLAPRYNLEMAVRCPHCDEAIRTIRIVGTEPLAGRVHVHAAAQRA